MGTNAFVEVLMTFLQPFILFGLPLILLPILIHLLNRLRHRPQPWGAMQFLLAASKSSIHQARLKQFLILLFRTLAVLALILFLARPWASGYLSWAVSTAPESILLLVDRSASMGHRSVSGMNSKRETLLTTMSKAASGFEESSHLVLIDSATRQAQRLDSAKSLLDHPLCLPTDSAADIPSMLQSALNWLVENESGSAEIWIGSDLQSSTWKAEDARWKWLLEKFESLPKSNRIRLFVIEDAPFQNDVSLNLADHSRRFRANMREMIFSLDIDRSQNQSDQNQSETSILELLLDGVSSQIEIESEGIKQRWRHRVQIGEALSGWGSFTLSADANLRNNSVYFVYGEAGKLSAIVISSDAIVGSILQIGASDFQSNPPHPAKRFSEWNVPFEDWTDQSLLIWQAPIPDGKLAESLESFARDGGVVLFLPPNQIGENAFQGFRWGKIETANTSTNASENAFSVGRWEQVSGPLADTDEGHSLPMHQLKIYKRRSLLGYDSLLASYDDGSPLLARKSLGQGAIYFLNTLPRPDWSMLSEGGVLIPFIQRLLQDGSRRQEKISFALAGELDAQFEQKNWTNISGNETKDPRWNAGVYRSGDRWLAINRPSSEDESDQLDLARVESLFDEIPIALQKDQRQNESQGEVWRLFLFGMLAFLIVESFLSLPTPTKSLISKPAL